MVKRIENLNKNKINYLGVLTGFPLYLFFEKEKKDAASILNAKKQIHILPSLELN